MTPADVLARVGAIADRAMAQPIRTPPHDLPLSQAARALVGASAVEWIATGPRIHILCPASATFDAAEALWLELVAVAPPGVAVDVEIAPGGEGSAEDQAGRRLFAKLRRRRLARVACGCSSPELGECSTCSPEHEAYCNGYACAGCNSPTACACHGGPR